MERRKSRTDPTRGIYPRGNVWWLNLRLDKQSYPISLQTEDLTKAIAEAIKVRENPERYIIRPGKWDREVEEYLQAKRDGTAPGKRHRGDTTTHTRDSLKKFHDYAGLQSASTARRHHIDGWIEKMREDGLADTSITTHYARVTGFFRWGVAEAKCRETPCVTKLAPILPHVVARDEVMSTAQVNAALSVNKRDDIEFVLLCGCHAGMRKEEIISARPSWFDFTGGHVTIPTIDPVTGFECKNKKRHTVPLSRKFIAFLERTGWLKEPGRAYMLHPEANSKPYRWDPDRPIKKLFAAVDFPGSMHSMRHTFASHALASGKTVWEVAQWLGDTVRMVEQTYGHFIPRKDALKGMYE